VKQQDWETANEVYEMRENLQPYALCGLTCIQIADNWQKASGLDYLPMQYIFEDGDQYKGQLRTWCEKEYGKEPIFRKKVSKSPRGDEYPLTPLQVGDFLAYEIGKFYSIVDPERDALFEKFRESFRLVGSITPKWGELSAYAIKVGSNVLGIPKRRKD